MVKDLEAVIVSGKELQLLRAMCAMTVLQIAAIQDGPTVKIAQDIADVARWLINRGEKDINKTLELIKGQAHCLSPFCEKNDA